MVEGRQIRLGTVASEPGYFGAFLRCENSVGQKIPSPPGCSDSCEDGEE